MAVIVASTPAQKWAILGLPQVAVAVRGLDMPVVALLADTVNVLWLNNGAGEAAIFHRQIIPIPLTRPETPHIHTQGMVAFVSAFSVVLLVARRCRLPVRQLASDRRRGSCHRRCR